MPVSDPSSSTGGFTAHPFPPTASPWSTRSHRPRPLSSAWEGDRTASTRLSPPECAQFVLDPSDRIQSYKIASAQRWFFQDVDLAGKSLRQILCEIRPDWDSCLPPCLNGADTVLYLPDAIPGTTGLVLALHRLSHAGLTFVTLTPELAPADKLKEAGIGDFHPDIATFTKLFLKLRTVEGRLDHYLAHLPGVIFHQRADLSFAFIGPGCESLLGVPAQSLARDSQALLRLIHPADERNYYQELDRNSGATQPFSLVYRVQHPVNSTCIYLLDVRSPVRSSSGLLLGYEGLWLDITRQKIAEHGLTTRAWKENLSILTSGLLNDFGNVMTGIFSLSELYQPTLAENHPLRDGLCLIKDNALQAQRVVRKIIELNREASGEKSYVNLGKVIRDQMDLIKVILPRGTQLTGPATEGDWPVYVDEISFRQTLMNLAMNARDALRGQGEIRVLLRQLDPGDAPLVDTIPPLRPSAHPMIELVFADNGRGIGPAHLARVFDPFFSTKDSNRGAGLGLYNARLFAEAHQGQIAVRSSVGRGTEIVLLLPRADLSLLEADAVKTAGVSTRKKLRVLFLDTDATEEGSLVETLRARDWEVRSVSTADHTRRTLRQEGVRVDLLVIRPRQTSNELRSLLAEVHRDHPGLPIALALVPSGTSDLSTTLRTQVDLILTDDIADADAADSLAKLLRLP